jgi:hypothetical protein
MAWLGETKGVHPDAQLREDSSDWRRISEVILSVPAGTPGSRLLSEYYEFLRDKLAEEKITVRSIRLALRPAVSLLLKSDQKGLSLPNQTALDQYLLESPGQKAAVSGFICFMKERYQLMLILRVDSKRVAAKRKKKLEAELLTLMDEASEGEDFVRRWLSVALAYFHDLPRGVGKKATIVSMSQKDNGVSVTYDGASYWVPTIIRKNLPNKME